MQEPGPFDDQHVGVNQSIKHHNVQLQSVELILELALIKQLNIQHAENQSSW